MICVFGSFTLLDGIAVGCWVWLMLSVPNAFRERLMQPGPGFQSSVHFLVFFSTDYCFFLSHSVGETFRFVPFFCSHPGKIFFYLLRARPKAERVFAEYENFLKLSDRPTDRDAFQRPISFEPSYRLTNGFRHLKATFNKSFVLAL